MLVLALAAPGRRPRPAAPSPAQPAAALAASRLKATATKTEVTVGEAFSVEVKATRPRGGHVTFPGEAVTDGFEMRTVPSDPLAEAAPAPEPGTHRYEAAVFALGEAEVPPIPCATGCPTAPG